MSEVLCAANSYEGKYYLNPKFSGLPKRVKDELQIACVLFTEEVGGILMLSFEDDGELYLTPMSDDEDITYDEIGSGLKIGQFRREKRELLEGLGEYYRMVILGEV